MSGWGLVAGDRVHFVMLKSTNGCLFPATTHDNNSTQFECVVVEGLVIGIEFELAEISYLCVKCNRNFVTTILTEQIRSPVT